MQSLFRGTKRGFEGKVPYLSEKASWMSRKRDAKDFQRAGENDRHFTAQMVELVDTPDLGSGAARCGGSSPLLGILSNGSLISNML